MATGSQADTNRVKLSFVEEVTYGEIPSGPPTLIDIPYTGESLRQDTGTVQSATIRDDRQIQDVIRTTISAAGSINWELIYNAFPDVIAASFLSAGFSTVVDNGAGETDISLVDSDDSINRVSGSFITDGYAVNQWMRIRGFATYNADGDQFGKIATVAANKITFSQVTKAIADESAGDTVLIRMGGQVVNGVTCRTFDWEKNFTDLTNRFEVLTGMFPNAMNLAVNNEGIITGSHDWLGKLAQSGVATIGDGSNTAASTNQVNNSVDNVLALFNGTDVIDLTNFTWALANNGRVRSQVGTLGAVSIGTGAIGLTGTLQAYLIDAALMDEYLAFTNSSIALVIKDENDNAQILDQPRIRWTSGQRVAGGQNADVIADMGWTAYRHPTENVTARYTTFDGPQS